MILSSLLCACRVASVDGAVSPHWLLASSLWKRRLCWFFDMFSKATNFDTMAGSVVRAYISLRLTHSALLRLCLTDRAVIALKTLYWHPTLTIRNGLSFHQYAIRIAVQANVASHTAKTSDVPASVLWLLSIVSTIGRLLKNTGFMPHKARIPKHANLHSN